MLAAAPPLLNRHLILQRNIDPLIICNEELVYAEVNVSSVFALLHPTSKTLAKQSGTKLMSKFRLLIISSLLTIYTRIYTYFYSNVVGVFFLHVSHQ